MKRRATILMAALAVLGTVGGLAPGDSRLFAQTQPASPPAADPAQILLSDQSTPAQRDLAAARLVAEGSDAAQEALVRALGSGNPALSQPAAAALANAAQPPAERFTRPLLALLQSQVPAAVQREAGRALGGLENAEQIAPQLAEIAASNAAVGIRQGAVAGLRRIPTKQSAATLVQLLDGQAPEPLERDAGEALVELTGLDISWDDRAGWRDWWAQAGQLDEVAFRAELAMSRANLRDSALRRANNAQAALLNLARQQYRRLQNGEQAEVLLEYLRHPLPEMREVGVRLVLEDASYAQEINPRVMAMLRDRVSDPEARVRRVVAQIVQRKVDQSFVEPLVSQMQREQDPGVKVAQIVALSELSDPRALPALLEALESRSPSVQVEAARAAARLAVDASPARVREVALQIRQVFDSADPATRAGRRMRGELVAALSQLDEPSLVDFYIALLNDQPLPSAAVREMALRGLMTLGNTQTGNTVVSFLSDDDPKVREAAVRALGTVSLSFERAEILRRLLEERHEPAESVRRAAWETLQVLFPKATDTTLSRWPDYFRDQPERRLTILRVLADRAAAADDGDLLAYRRQEMGDVLMNDLNRPSEAADLYRQALDYSLEHNVTPATTHTRLKNVMQALLRAKRFDEATVFAAEMIRRDRSLVELIGTTIKLESERFVQNSDVPAARALIDAVLQMPEPLDARTVRQLQTYRDALPANPEG